MKLAHKFDGSGKWLPGEEMHILPNESGEYTLPEGFTFEELPQPNWKPIFNKVKNQWEEKATEEEKAALIGGQAEKTEVEILREENEQLNLAIIDLYEILMG